MYNKKEKVFIETSVIKNCCNTNSFGEICVKCNMCNHHKSIYTGSEEIEFEKAKKYLHNL